MHVKRALLSFKNAVICWMMMMIMMMIQLQSSCLLRISDNAKLPVSVSCVDVNSFLHWFQTSLCGTHKLELVTIQFC